MHSREVGERTSITHNRSFIDMLRGHSALIASTVTLALGSTAIGLEDNTGTVLANTTQPQVVHHSTQEHHHGTSTWEYVGIGLLGFAIGLAISAVIGDDKK